MRKSILTAITLAAALTTASSIQAQEAVTPVKGRIFAHRGGAHEYDENTMGAFRATYDKGLRGYETDIRMTKDGLLVILHDEKLDRTHNGTGILEHKTADEIRDITTKKSGEKFLFLEEFIEYLADKPDMYVEFEMKTSNKELYPQERLEDYCRKLYDIVSAQHPPGCTYVFTSFDDRPLKIIRAIDPNAQLMFIHGGPLTDEIIKKAKDLNVQRVAARMEGTTRVKVREAQKQGLIVTGWPGHTLNDYFLGLGLEVDAICTDIPVQVQEYINKNSATAK